MTQHHIIIAALTDSVDRLSKDLKPLEQQMINQKTGMLITYNGETTMPRLVVYADPTFKIYIPKKYDGWNVEFIAWDSNDDEFELDIDTKISVG